MLTLEFVNLLIFDDFLLDTKMHNLKKNMFLNNLIDILIIAKIR